MPATPRDPYPEGGGARHSAIVLSCVLRLYEALSAPRNGQNLGHSELTPWANMHRSTASSRPTKRKSARGDQSGIGTLNDSGPTIHSMPDGAVHAPRVDRGADARSDHRSRGTQRAAAIAARSRRRHREGAPRRGKWLFRAGPTVSVPRRSEFRMNTDAEDGDRPAIAIVGWVADVLIID